MMTLGLSQLRLADSFNKKPALQTEVVEFEKSDQCLVSACPLVIQ